MSKHINVRTYQRINGAGLNKVKPKRSRWIGWLAALLIGVLTAAVSYIYVLVSSPIGRHTETVYLLVSSTDTQALKKQIHKKVYPRYQFLFNVYWRQYDMDSSIRTGRYAIPVETSVSELMEILTEGPQALVSVPLVGVRTETELISTFDKFLMADSAELLAMWTDSAHYVTLGLDRESARSLLFAESYELPWDITPRSLMDSIYRRYDDFWTAARRTEAKALGLTPTEVSILASIVESESAKLDEYPRISGLYLNRIRKGIPLQSDPTVKFALEDFSLRRILHSYLTTSSPYNTYYVKGLPPGPICLPKRSTLDAVLRSEAHSYIYMCAKEDFSGYHNFATTYAEHLRNARLYQTELNKRGIK